MRTASLAVLFWITDAVSGAAFAQVAGHIDAGSGTMRTGSESPFGIVRLSPTFQLTGSRLLISTEGDFAGHTEHGWQTRGHLTARLRQNVFGALEAQLGVESGVSRTRWGRSAGGWLGEGRLRLGSERRGLALGLGSGHSFASGGSQPLSRIEAGGWSRVGRFDLGFWLKRTGLTVPGSQTDDREPADTLQVGGAGGRRLIQDHYTDIEASLGWARGSLALEAGAGRRFGKSIRFTSWYVRALYQLTPRVALVASSGQFPVDLVSGLPSGGFTTLSMRFNLRDEGSSHRVDRSTVAQRGRLFSATRSEDGTHLIAIRLPPATVVEMMGDFTDWTPVLLVPGDEGEWRLRMRISPGVHEVNVRVDGGAWMVPPGLTAVDDGLGSRVGLFSLE